MCRMTVTRVFVNLLNEGVPTARPAPAEELGEGIYRILATPNYDPDDEEWQFLPGAIVRVREHTFPNGVTGLLAEGVVELPSDDPS
jgi:hypothetical protein